MTETTERDGRLEPVGDRWRIRFTRALPHAPEKVWRGSPIRSTAGRGSPTRRSGTSPPPGAQLGFPRPGCRVRRRGTRHRSSPALGAAVGHRHPALRAAAQRRGHPARVQRHDHRDRRGERDTAGWHVCIDRLESALDGTSPDGNPGLESAQRPVRRSVRAGGVDDGPARRARLSRPLQILHHAELVGRFVARRPPEVDGRRTAGGADDQVRAPRSLSVQVALGLVHQRGGDAPPAMRRCDREAVERATPSRSQPAITVPMMASPSTATISAPGDRSSRPPIPPASSVLDGSAVATVQNVRISGMSSTTAGRSTVIPRNLYAAVTGADPEARTMTSGCVRDGGPEVEAGVAAGQAQIRRPGQWARVARALEGWRSKPHEHDVSRVAQGHARLLRRPRSRQLEVVLAGPQARLRRVREGAVPRTLRGDRARVRPAARVPPEPRHTVRQGQEPITDRGRGRHRERGRHGVLRADLERRPLRRVGLLPPRPRSARAVQHHGRRRTLRSEAGASTVTALRKRRYEVASRESLQQRRRAVSPSTTRTSSCCA